MSKNYVEEEGDLEYCLDHLANMLDYARYCREEFSTPPADFMEMKLRIICCASFYELYFKYRLGLINKSLIWDKPENYDKNKHRNGSFVSKKHSTVVAYGINFGRINLEEKELISEVELYRNKVLHFGLNENQNYKDILVMVVKYDFYSKNLHLINKLLDEIKDNLGECYKMSFAPYLIDKE